MNEPELLVSISIRFPVADRPAIEQRMAPIVAAAIAVGGISTNLSIQPYDPDSDD